MENATFRDGCGWQTLPRQLGVSHEPWQQARQVKGFLNYYLNIFYFVKTKLSTKFTKLKQNTEGF